MIRAVSYLEAGSQVARRVENLASRGLTLVHCWLESGDVPLHWQASTGTKPPVDIALSSVDGRLQGLEFVLQDEAVLESIAWGPDLKVGLTSIVGIPLFDRSLWSTGEWYIQEWRPNYVGWTSARDLLIAWVSPPIRIALECAVDNSLHLLFDDSDHLLGYRVFSVTEDERAAIGRAEP